MTVTENRRARLAQLIKQYGSQADLVRATGERQGEISGLLRTKSFGERKARKIEEKLGLPSGWLDMPNVASPESVRGVSKIIHLPSDMPEAPELEDEYVIIPPLSLDPLSDRARRAALSQGWPLERKRAFPMSWLTALGVDVEAAAFTVADNAGMEPHISVGAILLVNMNWTKQVHGKVYVISFQDEIFVRRIFKTPAGGLSLRSDNPDKALFPDTDIDASALQLVQVLAQVATSIARV